MALYELLRALCGRPQPGRAPSGPRVLVVVEGAFDIEFLRRISRRLAADTTGVPDLAALEQRGELVFFPFGGDPCLWTDRLAPFGLPELHLYDRELPPETARRQATADRVNQRSGCRAVITGKRALENYLHPQAIAEACDVQVRVGDHDHVADLIAQQQFRARHGVDWHRLTRRAQQRWRNRVKKTLHTRVADRMTWDRLAERDPQGELVSWLQAIVHLMDLVR
jgi:hypothetical protein